MKVFVTGGTGFVGRYVVRELIDRGHEVILGVRNPAKAEKLFSDAVVVEKVDFADKDSISSALSKHMPESVIHLIGILYELRSKGITFETVHYLFSKNLYEVCKDLGIKRAVHMSALGTHDRAPSRYHQTKRWAENILIDSGIGYAILRPSLILGPEQRLFSDMDRITKIIPLVALPGGGSYRFQPVDVRDVARCFATLATDTREGIYELCGTKAVSFKELLRNIFNFWGRKVLLVPMPGKLMFLAGKLIERILEPPPFSSDQMLMMWKDNVCGVLGDAISEGVREITGKEPVPYEESLKWALEGYRKLTS